MKNLYIKTMILILAGLLFAGQGFAAITAEQAARLGNDLTPLGGEKAGNADGTIPAWDGGITSPPAGYQKGHAPSRPLCRRQGALHHHGRQRRPVCRPADRRPAGDAQGLPQLQDERLPDPSQRLGTAAHLRRDQGRWQPGPNWLRAATVSLAGSTAFLSRFRKTASRRSGTTSCAGAAMLSIATSVLPR